MSRMAILLWSSPRLQDKSLTTRQRDTGFKRDLPRLGSSAHVASLPLRSQKLAIHPTHLGTTPWIQILASRWKSRAALRRKRSRSRSMPLHQSTSDASERPVKACPTRSRVAFQNRVGQFLGLPGASGCTRSGRGHQEPPFYTTAAASSVDQQQAATSKGVDRRCIGKPR